MLGRIAYLDWKFDESEKHFQESLRLNPNSIITIYWYSELLSACRRFSEALKFLNSITHLEPLSFKSCLRIGRAFYKMDRYETALVYFTDALDMEPDNYEILFLMAGPLIELGRFEEAVFYIQKSLDINYNVEVFSMLGYISALKGEKNKAYEIIEQIKSQFNEACELSTTLARIYFALGEKETAYQYLDQAFENHEADLCSTVSDPRLKKIKNEPQFRDLIKRMGIPLNNSSTF
jgi:tetratricopeptide (TPR) repeat protein